MADLDNRITPARIVIQDEVHAIIASQQGRKLAARLGFSAVEQMALGTAILEIARNIYLYAGHGEISLAVVQEESNVGIHVIARDSGPGIADTAQAMRDGYSSGNSLGLGLPGARRLMDTFELHSTPGEGTVVSMKKWRR